MIKLWIITQLVLIFILIVSGYKLNKKISLMEEKLK